MPPSEVTATVRQPRRRIRRLCAGALPWVTVWVTVVGCASLDGTAVPYTAVPQGGVHAYTSTVTVNDVWLNAPEGVPRGGAADLRLFVVNEFGGPDALTGVSSPLVRGAELCVDGRPVEGIPLPPGEAVNLEWGDSATVRLIGIRRPLAHGSWMPVSLHFVHAKTVTMQVVAGPLGPPGGISTRGPTAPTPGPDRCRPGPVSAADRAP